MKAHDFSRAMFQIPPQYNESCWETSILVKDREYLADIYIILKWTKPFLASPVYIVRQFILWMPLFEREKRCGIIYIERRGKNGKLKKNVYRDWTSHSYYYPR